MGERGEPVPVRFAFYGRVSTEDNQDPEASRNWQLTRARALIDKHGVVVEQFFDVGQSRSIPWKRRPEAARLLAAIRAGPEFDAVVIGEPQRVLRQSVRAHPSCSSALRRSALGAGGRRSDRPGVRGALSGDVGVRRHVEGQAQSDHLPSPVGLVRVDPGDLIRAHHTVATPNTFLRHRKSIVSIVAIRSGSGQPGAAPLHRRPVVDHERSGLRC